MDFDADHLLASHQAVHRVILFAAALAGSVQFLAVTQQTAFERSDDYQSDQ